MNRAASALAKQRWAKRDIEKTCPFCEQRFKGVREQVYCTPAHQNAAAAQRFRDRRRSVSSPAPIRAGANDPPGLAPLLEKAAREGRAGNDAEAARWQRLADQLMDEIRSVE